MFKSRPSFEEEIFVNAPPQTCSTALFTAENYPTLHPLIQRVEDVSYSSDAQGQPMTTFYAIDRLRMGILSFPLKYKTVMTLVNGGESIAFDAYSTPSLHLHSVISFEPQRSGTRVSEQVSIEVFSPLAAYSVNQAQAAHKLLFELSLRKWSR